MAQEISYFKSEHQCPYLIFFVQEVATDLTDNSLAAVLVEPAFFFL